ncbi:putative Na-Ca exchanger/integrin-beta4 [Planktothrix agardhii NIVA-CYA 126/8]|uniref:Putative Na-Ca exchanger/integrin-beta4 n=1 Tax=Planktothrix agardhii (strain NIVA-CYA 126/8) TaxID=388467 RepID=A0A073CCZ7_PLAA1|nr:Calx-beta domain-containing protein [Planktothrix agardhii]KEI65787.1 putative Na-Ca exchanger/integrin-beta4 [Planktothrix agardhii NIVA-CYA 126/8]
MSLDTFDSGNLFFSPTQIIPNPQTLSFGLGVNLPMGRSFTNITPTETNFIPTNNSDLIIGTAFQDNIFALGGNDTIYGLEGNDILGGNQQADLIFGNLGNDSIYAGQDDDTLAGGQDDDLIFGDVGNDFILGDRGADTLFGNQNNDIIYGGKEDDLVAGGEGDDQLFGDFGDDILYGDFGADTVTGGDGNDLFYIGKTMGGFAINDADIITDFTLNQDTIGLLGDLTFSALNITQGTGEYANDTIIQDKNSSEYLAILKNVNSNSLNSDNFVFDGFEPTPDPTPIPTPDPTPIPTSVPTPIPTPDPTPVPTPVPLSVLGFSSANFSVNENGTLINTITINRTGESSGLVTAQITPTDGTATAILDYTNTPVTVTFADGDITPKTVIIPVIDDTIFEPTETVNLALTITAGTATVGTQNTAILQIVDNDPSDNLLLNSATYLGTTGNDSGASVEISPVDNNIIIAGNFNGVGAIQRLQNGNTASLSNTPLGGIVNDLDVDRDSGEIVAVGDFGIKVYNPTANTVLWSQPGTFNRVAIANDGTVATLNNSTDTIILWNGTGTQLTSTTLTGTNVNPADITIDPTTKQVFVTGYNQVTSLLQTPFLRGFDSALNSLWKTWDFSATEVTGQNLRADTRGERITIGKDGGLYLLGKTDGGNNVFQRNGQNITQTLATLVNVDSFNNFSGAGAGSFTFHAKINPNTGIVDQGQFIVTRTSTGANSFTPNSITADEFGNIYIGGSSAFQLQNRPGKTINSQPVGAYTLGEMAVLGLSADYTIRKFWTPLTQTGDVDGAKGSVNGFAVAKGQAVILGTVTQPSVTITTNAINPNPLGGNDAYLATWSV